jgi:hypothetical protein
VSLLDPVFRVHATAQTLTQTSAGCDAFLDVWSRLFTLIRQMDAPADDFRLRYLPDRGQALAATCGRTIEGEGRSVCHRFHTISDTITMPWC